MAEHSKPKSSIEKAIPKDIIFHARCILILYILLYLSWHANVKYRFVRVVITLSSLSSDFDMSDHSMFAIKCDF
ncbi:Protein of unknown function [Gryllus bimaculatus]|nr:Protein of unknown function [Gryllus bimaculatus]